MVGLVVVSHSRALAEAAVALALEMPHAGDLAVRTAAGLDETTLGTDAVAIMAAIEAADRGDGVVVLMDLGSAVLSAELALEMLDDEARDRVVLCPAPLVEGLVAAVVAAASGAPRDEVAAEAVAALQGKQSQLGVPATGDAAGGGVAGEGVAGGVAGEGVAGGDAAGEGVVGGDAASRATGDGQAAAGRVTVINAHGLHARPAARLVTEARRFDAVVEVRNLTTGSGWVPASSLSRVATLGAVRGHEIEVRASGVEARQAVDDIVALAGRGFDDDDADLPGHASGSPAGVNLPIDAAGAPGKGPTADAAGTPGNGSTADVAGASEEGPAATPVSRQPSRRLLASLRVSRGQAASAGVAIGPAWLAHSRSGIPDISAMSPEGDADHEWRRVEAALEVVRGEIERARELAGAEGGIFEAHLLLLDDSELLGEVRERVGRGDAAPRAFADAAGRVAGEFEGLGDAYLAGRAADVRAVAGQIVRSMLGGDGEGVLDGDGVLVARDLTPAEAVGLRAEHVTGVLLAEGSPTSHGAILARTRGIPMVVGAGPEVLEVGAGTVVALDGGTGEFAVGPDAATLEEYRRRAEEGERRHAAAVRRSGERATTADGVEIAVAANVGSVGDAAAAAEHGADLAGLVRTEFLFLDRDTAPDVEEQVTAYREIAEALGGRRVTLRTLDVGGDKPLRYAAPMGVEHNPFLGVRGLRYSLRRPELFRAQLRAIVQVARETPVSVMFPMVSSVSELVEARRMLAAERPPESLRVGIMVEVPAAALKAASFRPHVDFVSIGTNDLTQYALAAERGNPAVPADGLDPAVLRLIGVACRELGRTVAVCGELAGDEAAVPLLVALGVRELSVAPPAVPLVKEAVRATTIDRDVAARALELPDAEAVRALMAGRLQARSESP